MTWINLVLDNSHKIHLTANALKKTANSEPLNPCETTYLLDASFIFEEISKQLRETATAVPATLSELRKAQDECDRVWQMYQRGKEASTQLRAQFRLQQVDIKELTSHFDSVIRWLSERGLYETIDYQDDIPHFPNLLTLHENELLNAADKLRAQLAEAQEVNRKQAEIINGLSRMLGVA